jgi:hypothetical protein
MVVSMVLVVYSIVLVMCGPNCALHASGEKELRKMVTSLRLAHMMRMM